MAHTHSSHMITHTTVYGDTVFSLFIAFAVACVSTSIQGMVAHAFRSTIGDIIVSDNSLADVDHIVPMLPAPTQHTTTPRQNTRYKNSIYTAIEIPNVDTYNYMRNSCSDMDDTNDNTRYKPTPAEQRVSSGKRLDARGFFQSLPMQTS